MVRELAFSAIVPEIVVGNGQFPIGPDLDRRHEGLLPRRFAAGGVRLTRTGGDQVRPLSSRLREGHLVDAAEARVLPDV